MAKDESFLLLSLSDSKSKKIAQAVNNESCRKILDYLARTKAATETKIGEELKIPLPTVHYNLKQLVDVKLVNVDEFHYSEKGKEVNHYTLSNKYIIIAPREEYSILEKLKKMLPAFGVILGGTFIIKLIEFLNNRAFAGAKEASVMMADEAAPMMAKLASAPSPETINAVSFHPGIASWFFIGGVAALFVYIMVDWIKNKK
jgi:DNA-binding transcriptional ArsR family regulator